MSQTHRKEEYLRVYFDTETFNHNTSEYKLPVIIPFLIGAWTHEPGSYRFFIGLDATEQFLEWLFKISKGKVTTLIAFNIDYDWWSIFPTLKEEYPDVRLRYRQCGHGRFISGNIVSPEKKLRINLRDLWVWNKNMSLKDYYQEIEKLANEDSKWGNKIKEYKIEKLEKLSIDDYHKEDMFEQDGELFYYDKQRNLKRLNLQQELSYLKQDVVGLPLVLEFIDYFQTLCCSALSIPKPPYKMKFHSIPSFGRYMLEQHLKNKGLEDWDLNDRYKIQCTREEYNFMDGSYFGGFSGVNRWLPKVELEEAKIKCYDVNSEYPWVMYDGVPYGDVYDEKPDEAYCVWYEIYFEKEVAPGVLYRYKPKYDFFNNDFFGKNFFLSKKACWLNRKYYILREVVELFKRVCDSYVVIDKVKYQKISQDIRPFIYKLYEIKSNKEEYSYILRQSVKLILNSFYGKLAERFHSHYYELEGWEMVRKDNDDEERWSILPGLYITSLSRVKLLTAVYDEVDNGNVVLCSDTDSIKMIENNPPKFEISDTRLGAWKFEGDFTSFYHINKCKKYYSFNKFTGDKKLVYSGIKGSYLEMMDHENLKTLYDPENDVLFKEAKNASFRNELYQIVIRDVDISFNAKPGCKPTHLWHNGVVIPYGEHT